MVEWSGKEMKCAYKIEASMPGFFDPLDYSRDPRRDLPRPTLRRGGHDPEEAGGEELERG